MLWIINKQTNGFYVFKMLLAINSSIFVSAIASSWGYRCCCSTIVWNSLQIPYWKRMIWNSNPYRAVYDSANCKHFTLDLRHISDPIQSNFIHGRRQKCVWPSKTFLIWYVIPFVHTSLCCIAIPLPLLFSFSLIPAIRFEHIFFSFSMFICGICCNNFCWCLLCVAFARIRWRAMWLNRRNIYDIFCCCCRFLFFRDNIFGIFIYWMRIQFYWIRIFRSSGGNSIISSGGGQTHLLYSKQTNSKKYFFFLRDFSW